MSAQYDFANNFLEQVFRAGPLQDFRLEMDETLGALRALVQARKTQNDVREAVFPHARNRLPAQPYEPTLPNATLAMASLRIAKGKQTPHAERHLTEVSQGSLTAELIRPSTTDNPRVGYLWLCNIMSIESFTDRALRVLFSSESSTADYLIVSIGLYWLFSILSIASPDQDLGTHVRREDLVKESRLCRENLETSLSTMPFHFPGDEDHIEALVMAVSDRDPTCSSSSQLLSRHTSP